MDSKTETDILNEEIQELEFEGRLTGEKKLELNARLGPAAFREGRYGHAQDAFRITNDLPNLRKVAEAALAADPPWIVDSFAAFHHLKDREGMQRVLVKGMQHKYYDESTLGITMLQFLGEETADRIFKKYKTWVEGMADIPGKIYATPIGSNIKQASNLAGKYDHGIAISRGGLFTGYMFNLFGLDTQIVDYHKDDRSPSVRWMSPFNPQNLKGKKLVVFDKDVVTGETTGKVLEELVKHGPTVVDLVLTSDPIPPFTRGIGTIAANISPDYNQVYYPKDFSYNCLHEAVEHIEKILSDNKA